MEKIFLDVFFILMLFVIGTASVFLIFMCLCGILHAINVFFEYWDDFTRRF